MRTCCLVALLSIAAAAAACGGSSTPASPSSTQTTGGGATGAAGAATQIYILGRDGGGAFRPSPVAAPSGGSFVWINSDTEVHRIVAVDGTFDTGDLQPDAQSAPVVVGTAGTRYYCPLHPGEVGGVTGANGSLPPCSGQYCG